jgi:hypothetical protein
VSQTRRSCGLSTAEDGETRLRRHQGPVLGGKSPEEGSSQQGSIPRVIGTNPGPEGAAAPKGLDSHLRSSARGIRRERGNCGVLPPHLWVAAALASGARTPQGRGSVVLGGVTSTHGDDRAGSQGEGSQSDRNSQGVKERRGDGTDPENPRRACATYAGTTCTATQASVPTRS